MLQRVDLHVHSLHSSKPYSWFLRTLRSAECYTRVAEVYRLARQRGMTAVTLADHDTIDGALELCATHPNTFVSEEISARFPEDGCVVHTIAVDLTEAQHREIQRLRRNIYELMPYLHAEGIPAFWCHPLSHVNSRLRPWHLRACLLMFRLLEVRNGTRDAAHERQLRAIAASMTPEKLARFAEEQPRAPWLNQQARYGLVGGSDDHGAVGIARAFTEYAGEASGAGVRRALHDLAVTPAGEAGTGSALAYNAYGVAMGTVRSSGQLGRALAGPDAPPADAPPSLSMAKFFAGLRASFSALGGSLAEVGAKGHLDELHRQVGAALDGALVHRWRQATDTLARELAARRVAEAADAVPELLKLALAELPYVLSYRYFSRDRRAAYGLPRDLLDGPTDEAPRVAIVSDTIDDTNGVAIGLTRLLATARSLGYRLELIGPARDEDAAGARADAADGITRVPTIYRHRLPEYPSLAWGVPHLPTLLRVLCDRRIDLVQVATPGPMGIAAAIAGRLLGVPVIGQFHTDVPRYALHLLGDPTAADVVDRFVTWFYRSLDLVLAPSEHTARALVDKGLDSAKVRRIARGVPLVELTQEPADAALRERITGDPESFLVLYVGRISKEKNLELALAGFERLLRAVPRAHFALAGDGPLREALAARGLRNVHLLGERTGAELRALYASSDVFLFPSTTDTFGNAVVEAIAAGLPVITLAGTAVAEHCEHGINGFAVTPDDAGEIAMRLSWLLQNPPLRARMSLESRRLAQRYAPERAAHELFAEYFRFLAHRPRGAEARARATRASAP